MPEDLTDKLCGHRAYMDTYDLREGAEEYRRAIHKLTIFPPPEDQTERLARELANMGKEELDALVSKVMRMRSEAGMHFIGPSNEAEVRRQIVMALIKKSLSERDGGVERLIDEAMRPEAPKPDGEGAERAARRILDKMRPR